MSEFTPLHGALALAPLLITPEEQTRAAATALSRSEPYNLFDPVFAYVERHAVQRPDQLAVEDAARTVSYAELVSEVRWAAGDLAADGVRAGQVVAVGGERGAQVITTFLALELLGVVYLPVDAGWPAARIQSILDDSRAALLITTGSAEAWEALYKGAEAAGCSTRPLNPAGETEPFAGPPVPGSLDQVRYVLYTSGSTGRPKGALVEHQGMLNHLWAKVQDLSLDHRDRLAQTAPLGFDISIWQMLAPLLVGGTVQVFTDEEAHDGARLLSAVADRGTTVLEIVPTLIRFLLDACDAQCATSLLTTLRWMIATGEELPPTVARRWFEAFPGIHLLNAYGPTECSDDVTHACLDSPGPEVSHLPIGRPIGNVTLYVLQRDEDGWSACPRGEAGELFVGGVAVGRGYLNDPERTAEAFFDDPFTSHGRLYRTGDRVRMLPRGELEYLGRIDRQVKIAGVRMELAEIEAALGTYPSVAACAITVVKPIEDSALVARESAIAPPAFGPARLVAYLSTSTGSWSRDALQAYLAERLPLTMVPQTYVELPEIPLTRNGKTDYAALPEPPRRERPPNRLFIPPVGEAATGIAAAVGEVLGTSEVGQHDTFLELGGDSLLAMRLLSRLRHAGSRATLRDVLLDGSPAALAKFGWTSTAHPADSLDGHDTPTAQPASRTRPLTPQQAGIYFHWRLEPDSPYYSYQGTLEMSGRLVWDRLELAWDLLLRENPQLLARFAETEETPVHEYPYWTVPLPQPEDLGALSPEDRQRAYRSRAAAEAARPFDLITEPALRVHSYTFGETEHRLLVTMHEILLDGWGATVLFQRLAALYEEAVTPGAAPVSDRAMCYDRYLDWHAELLRTREVAQAGAYWQRQLAGELPVLNVAHNPRPTQPSYRGSIVESVIERETMEGLRSAALRTRSTPFVYLLSAYTLALTYYGDADEVVIGAPMANRDRPEQTDVPAFMLAMLPFRISVTADMALGAFVEVARKVVLDGYAAADHPFGWTLRKLPAAARSSAATPVFQTMLNMLAYPAQKTAADGVSFRFVELDTGFTKYDCALYVQPHGSGELLVQFAYQQQLMDAEAARQMLESILLALRALVESPTTEIRALNLLPGSGGQALFSTGEGI